MPYVMIMENLSSNAVSLKEYIDNLRIEKAKIFMQKSNFTCTEIAKRIGMCKICTYRKTWSLGRAYTNCLHRILQSRCHYLCRLSCKEQTRYTIPHLGKQSVKGLYCKRICHKRQDKN